jgi:hypothetical protein
MPARESITAQLMYREVLLKDSARVFDCINRVKSGFFAAADEPI